MTAWAIGSSVVAASLGVTTFRQNCAAKRRKAEIERLHPLVYRDKLTDLANRRSADEFMQVALAERDRPLSAILVDVDHFKRINDRFGHDAGDSVLRRIADTIRASVRADDLAARWGGEEFMILFPGMRMDLARFRADRIRDDIASLSLEHEGRPLGRVTASFGVAASPEHGHAPDRLRQLADGALYAAKQMGRNRVCVAPIAR